MSKKLIYGNIVSHDFEVKKLMFFTEIFLFQTLMGCVSLLQHFLRFIMYFTALLSIPEKNKEPNVCDQLLLNQIQRFSLNQTLH